MKKLPAGSREFLGIIEPREGFVRFGFEKFAFEDHRGGDHGAGERAAAGFIHAGKIQESPGPGFLFEAQHGGDGGQVIPGLP